mmetsp:Transcript_116723/g.232677  ORF Transcript_116723/g.232677 Transcript_116723/m.232677 type:complete len:94 (-) Transcript_116723:179-460(-)
MGLKDRKKSLAAAFIKFPSLQLSYPLLLYVYYLRAGSHMLYWPSMKSCSLPILSLPHEDYKIEERKDKIQLFYVNICCLVLISYFLNFSSCDL